MSALATYTIQCSFDKAGILSLVSRRGSEEVKSDFLSGKELTANGMYIFTFMVTEKTTDFNIQYSVDSTVNEAIMVVHGGIY